MSGFSLTPQAVSRLADIFEWTIRKFGLPQAETYRRKLLDRCEALASGSTPHGRSCEALLKGDADAASLLYYREGGHYIIYRKIDGRLIIIDFVHKARDLENLLKKLGQ